jgi:hypothetical protein
MAGCVVGESKGESTETSSAIAAPPAFDDTTGAIHGLVTDTEGLPLVGATAGLVERAESSTTTSEAGDFTLSNIEPGTYTLAIAMLGYETSARKVEVVVGQVKEENFLLEPLAEQVAFADVQIKEGYIACSVRAYPGAPLGQPVIANGWYTGVAVCGLPVVNTTLGDKFLLNWETQPGVQELQAEMKWSTNQALGKGLGFIVEHVGGINNGKPIYGTATGVSPLKVYANQTKVLNVTEAMGVDCMESRCRQVTRAFAEANTTEFYGPVDPPPVGQFGKPSRKVDAGVVIDQRFSEYLTSFHYGARPDGYTALPDV